MNAPVTLPGLRIRPLDLSDARDCARVDAYVGEHPSGTIFHRPQWSRMVELGCGQPGLGLVAERAGRIVGWLPLTGVRSALFGDALVSAGFGTGGGIIADDERASDRLAEEAWAVATRQGFAAVELRGGPIPADWVPCVGVYTNFARDLPSDPEAVLASIPRRQRAEIRKSLGFGLDISAGSDPLHCEAFFRVYSESVRNLGTPVFPRRLFEAALSQFGPDADALIVWKDKRPISALVNFYHKGMSYAYWGGGVTEARDWRANDLIYYEALCHAIRRGCTRADFGRSKLGTGPWQRKRIWGFEETPLIYAERLRPGTTPREVNPLSPRYRLKIATWRRLPLWIANRLGPRIARGLG